MAKIIAPNKWYNGYSGSIKFTNGVSETENKYLINWFKEKGYDIIEENEEEPTEENIETPKKTKKK